MTDREKLAAYKNAYTDLLAMFVGYYNMTKVFDTFFCDDYCPVGGNYCDYDCIDVDRCAEKILAQFTEGDQ